MRTPILAAHNIDVSIDGKQILREVSIAVEVGEVVALVGPNGAGKSTLLSVLSGDQRPTHGRVEIDGADLTRRPVAELARIRAVQMQDARLSFAFTVTEVVAMGRAPWQRTAEDRRDEQVVGQAMGCTEVTHLATRTFPTLSGGERARTSFSRVLAQETAVLLLDEPTAALDIRHQEAVLSHARQRAAQGAAVVVVLHDLSLAAAYADRIVLLERGRVRSQGTPAHVLDEQVLSEVYNYPLTVSRDPHGGLSVLPVRHLAHHQSVSEVHS